MNDDHLPSGPTGEPLTISEDLDTGDRFLVYVAKDGVRAELRVHGDTFWATQAQMAHMFGVNVRTVSGHISNIFAEGELVAESVIRDSRITAADGKTYATNLYSLDVIISVGYRVSSRLGTTFRIWATQVLMQYLTKGFVIDDRRLKNPDGAPDHFEELLERVRDIRSSEKRMWLRISEMATFCDDYDPYDQSQKTGFFADIQNTLHWAILQKTASDIVIERVDHRKPNAGVVTFDGVQPTVAEACVAKNLLAEAEIKALNLVTSLMLEFFESQIEQRRPTTLGLFQTKLRELIKLDGRPAKPYGSSTRITSAQAREHAAREIKAFKEQTRLKAEERGDRELGSIVKAIKAEKKSR